MKKHKVLKIIGIILASILLLWAIINIIPPKKTIQNKKKSSKRIIGMKYRKVMLVEEEGI